MIVALEKETSDLKNECGILSKYMERTDKWTENVGRWIASVESAQLDRDTPRSAIPALLVRL